MGKVIFNGQTGQQWYNEMCRRHGQKKFCLYQLWGEGLEFGSMVARTTKKIGAPDVLPICTASISQIVCSFTIGNCRSPFGEDLNRARFYPKLVYFFLIGQPVQVQGESA